MSSTAAQAADSATARNFNPSWIRSAFHGGGGSNSSPRASTNEEEQDTTQLSQPVLSKNRYGREETLVLMPAVPRAPQGLNNCPFFVPNPREPLALSQPSELEQRLQLNINSSKAMSSLTPAERMNIAGGGNVNTNGAGGPNSPQARVAGNGWTPVKSSSWGRGAPQSGGTPNGRGSVTRPVGRGAPPVAQTDEGSSPFNQQKFAYRGRGGLTTARGGSTTATNSRAQGLYDPRDPKDRPRNRLRSTSEEADGNEPNNGDGGWSRVNQYGRQNSNAWNKDDGSAWGGNADKENVSGSALKSDSTGTMPEWMDDDDDVTDKPEEVAGGSFDDEGRYRQPQIPEPVRQVPQREPPAPSWRPTAVQTQADSMKERASTSHSAFSGVPFAQPTPNVGQVAPGVPMAPPAVSATPPEFFYLDPSEKERGPFRKDQMDAWFKMGYFADNLKVRRSTDTAYKTLGELKHMNGALTAFDYKEPQAFPPVFPTHAAPFGGNIFSGNVWNDPLSSVYNPSMFAAHSISAAFDTKRMEEEARRMEHEKQAHLREMMSRQEEQARLILEKEMAFRMKEEEMKRLFEEERMRRELAEIELEKQVKAKLEREAEERRKIEEEMRRIEEERKKEQAKLAEEQRKLEEAKRALEEEHRRKEAELLRKKEEEEERKRRAEAAAEEHRKLLQKKAEEDAARIRQQQAAAAAAAAAKAAEEEEKRRAAKDAEKMFNDHDAWNISSSPKTASPSESIETPWQKATTKKTPAAKPAPAWSTVSQQNTAREKSLREIQEEEERQMLAEQRELARMRKEQESSSAASMQSGMWAGASQRINWNQPSVAARAPTKPAWGGATIESKPAASPAHWDGPSLQAANKPAAATPAKKQPALAKQTPAKQTPAKNTKDQSSNSFTAWVVKRLKEISSTVDADVLASFLESVENPNEVDDYIEGYLGSSKATKEFVKEYLHKRSESRKRKDTDKDDLSSASKAGTGSGTVGHGKKKKGKGQRLVIDGSCLGFRAAADSNRVNQGEIETVPLAPGQKR